MHGGGEARDHGEEGVQEGGGPTGAKGEGEHKRESNRERDADGSGGGKFMTDYQCAKDYDVSILMKGSRS